MEGSRRRRRRTASRMVSMRGPAVSIAAPADRAPQQIAPERRPLADSDASVESTNCVDLIRASTRRWPPASTRRCVSVRTIRWCSYYSSKSWQRPRVAKRLAPTTANRFDSRKAERSPGNQARGVSLQVLPQTRRPISLRYRYRDAFLGEPSDPIPAAATTSDWAQTCDIQALFVRSGRFGRSGFFHPKTIRPPLRLPR